VFRVSEENTQVVENSLDHTGGSSSRFHLWTFRTAEKAITVRRQAASLLLDRKVWIIRRLSSMSKIEKATSEAVYG